MIRKSMPWATTRWVDTGFPSRQTRNAFARRSCSIKSAGRRPVSSRLRLVGREQMEQRAFDRGLTRRRIDLRAQEVGDIEHVAGALAKRRDVGGGDIEIELRDRGRQLIQQAG